MTTLRPPRLDRVLAFIVFGPVWIGTGLALASVAIVPGASARVFVLAVGAAFVAGGIWTTIRLSRVAVHLSDDTLRDDGTKFAPLWRWRREALLDVRRWAGAPAV